MRTFHAGVLVHGPYFGDGHWPTAEQRKDESLSEKVASFKAEFLRDLHVARWYSQLELLGGA